MSLSLPLQIPAGLVLGLLLGLLWPTGAVLLKPLGAAFIAAIQMVVTPLIVSSVVLSGYRMGANIRQLGRAPL